MSKLNTIIITVLALSGLLIFLLLTNPLKLPLVALLVPFMLFGVVIYTILFFVSHRTLGFHRSISITAAIMVSMEISLALLLSSLHQLAVGDLVIMLLFGGLLLWYFAKLKA